jgi:ribonuclease HI
MKLHPRYIHIFTDGAAMVHKSKTGGWSAVILYKEKMKEIMGAIADTTNNQMEILACVKALEKIKTNNIPIKIYSDSTYVVNGMNEWRFTWQTNGWKSAKKKVKNRDLWEQLISLSEKQDDIEFIWLKGHDGHEWNERADTLASIAIENFLQKNGQGGN